MSDEYFKIQGPAVISFSGGRTSGYMLWRILQAHGGELPADVHPIFANTGKEMEETLEFVQQCGAEWGVDVTWLEYRPGKTFEVVNFERASRNGEPFEQIITERNFLPNPVARICTIEMKVLTMARYVTQVLGYDFFTNVVGIRADEPKRVAKLGDSGRKEFGRYAPLALADITAADVGRFWAANSFDLALPNRGGKTMHGNCDLCFLKGVEQVYALIREKPERALWWIEQEERIHSKGQIKGDAGLFRSDRPSYRQMYQAALDQSDMFGYTDDPILDCACTD